LQGLKWNVGPGRRITDIGYRTGGDLTHPVVASLDHLRKLKEGNIKQALFFPFFRRRGREAAHIVPWDEPTVRKQKSL